ncbi:hypothetical protein [Blautia argi]|uniref:hypothetical protein n=1 Tax=Blautia argi TaxID=1912897 RepID=UPI001FA87696|nr:hypothetical protein [Blautia argi]
MKKKIVSIALCAAMAAGLLAGCGKSSDSSTEKTEDGKTKIRMTYWNSEDTVKTTFRIPGKRSAGGNSRISVY